MMDCGNEVVRTLSETQQNSLLVQNIEYRPTYSVWLAVQGAQEAEGRPVAVICMAASGLLPELAAASYHKI